jgi:hypothetical protein
MATKNIKHQNFSLGDLKIKDVDDPTKSELIMILQKLADSRIFQRVTRDGFRAATQLGDVKWIKHFGSFPAFLEAAGLETPAHIKKVANQIAKHARHDYIKSVSNERLTWADKFVKPDNGNRFKTMIVASDFHDIECDPFALRMLVEACQQIKPDTIVLNGDVFDIPEFSKHPKDYREWDTVGRINAGLDIIKKIRLASPDSVIDFIEGNHEARVVRHIMSESPATMEVLADLHGMNMRKFFRLDDYEVNYIASGDLGSFTDAQMKSSVLSSERVYHNFILARHHPPSKAHPVDMPGFNGHHHCYHATTHWTRHLGSFNWIQLGSMHRRLASFTEGRTWNCGFLYAVVDTKFNRVNFDYVTVGDTGCVLGGQYHERLKSEIYPTLKAELRGKF